MAFPALPFDQSDGERTRDAQPGMSVPLRTGFAQRGRMDLKGLIDADLLSELSNAQAEILKVYTESDKRRAAWQRVIDAMRELERRYPPEAAPLN